MKHKDKLLHCAAGIVAGLLALVASYVVMKRPVPWTAAAAAVLLGAAKEAWDRWQNLRARKRAVANSLERPDPHTVDVLDGAATAAGGVLVAVGAALALGL